VPTVPETNDPRVFSSAWFLPLDSLLKWALVVGLAIVLAACTIQSSGGNVQAWNLLLVAAGGLSAGLLAGFAYGSYGRSGSNLSPVVATLNGLIGGAALTDLSKGHASAISGAFHLAGAGCGLPHSGGLIAAVLLAFFAPGFILAYIYQSQILNLIAAQMASQIDQLQQARDALRRGPDPLQTGEPEARPPANPATLEAARRIAASPGAGETGSPEKLRVDARAFAVTGDEAAAEKAIRRALRQRPDDTRLQVDLASTLIRQERHDEAIDLLETVVRRPDAPAYAWKLLGLAYLWRPGELDRSVDATRHYLQSVPDDPWAQLNLACAYAQKARARPRIVSDPASRIEALNIIQELLSDARYARTAPAIRARVRQLMQDGGDFQFWVDDTGLNELLSEPGP
jgi:tetratricopeptide (TPR) repeat protein